MKFLFSVLILLFGIAAAPAHIPRLDNGCVITAVEFQAEKSLHDHNVWARVVCFQWAKGGHAVCVFAMRNGDIWSYDHLRGSNSLNTRDKSIGPIETGLSPIYANISRSHFVD